jgi:hypothetical protein
MKTGRNEPRPCGSGKKFKKCCIDKPTPQARRVMTEPPPEMMRRHEAAENVRQQ